jgi:hypothetical protein
MSNNKGNSNNSTTSATTATSNKSNVHMLPKYRDRQQYMLSLAVVPIAVCVMAFARSAVYRLTLLPAECRSFGWYSSSSGDFQCDYPALDLHATAALAWLAIFAIQVTLLLLGKPSWHRSLGKLGLVGAFWNAGGMFWLAYQDTVNPMPKTDRPSDFTPFMFLVAFKLTVCLVLSTYSLMKKKNRDVEGHMVWMFRGFITSFTTPVIRFYPMVLRLLTGDDCFDRHRDKFVMGAMFVSELVSVTVYTLMQRKTQPVFWDTFMKLQVVTFLFALVNELRFASTHGMFVTGMVECAIDKYVGSVQS